MSNSNNLPAYWSQGAQVTVYVNSSAFSSNQQSAIARAFESWQQNVSNSNITYDVETFTSTIPPTHPENYIVVDRVDLQASGYPLDQLGVNLYRFHSDTGLMTDVDILIDDLVLDADYLYRLMIHEIGHNYGLGDCTECTNTVMYLPIGSDAEPACTVCDLQNIFATTNGLYGFLDPPDFAITGSPASSCAWSGDFPPSAYNVSVTSINGFTGAVTLTVVASPTFQQYMSAGVGVSPLSAGNSTTVSVNQFGNTPATDYPFTVIGTWYGRTRALSLTQRIGDYRLVGVDPVSEGGNPPTRTVRRGSQATYTMRLETQNCSGHPLYLIAGPFPSFVSATFSQQNLRNTGDETVMTVDVARKNSQPMLIDFGVGGYLTGSAYASPFRINIQ